MSLSNGHAEPPDIDMGELAELDIVQNIMTLRKEWMGRFDDARRNLEKECGHPEESEPLDSWRFHRLYKRHEIARKVIRVVPMETWKIAPDVYEEEDADTVTPFEEAWDALGAGLRGKSWFRKEAGSPIWRMLRRVDILSRIGHYGALLYGFDDGTPSGVDPIHALALPVKGVAEVNSWPATVRPGKKGETNGDATGGLGAAMGPHDRPSAAILSGYRPTTNESMFDPRTWFQPDAPLVVNGHRAKGGRYTLIRNAEATKGRTLLYLRAFPEHLAEIVSYETNPNSPRYGLPILYRITLNDPEGPVAGLGLSTGAVQVHWTRVQHVAETEDSSDLFAAPACEMVLNRLLDIKKLYGSGAEMFFRGGMNGMAFVKDAALGKAPINRASVRSELEKFRNGLQRDIILDGLNPQTLAPNISDPTPFIDGQLAAVAIALDMPVRILMGSERGELSSAQDAVENVERFKGRRRDYVVPGMIVPFVDRNILAGCLPEPGEEGYNAEFSEDVALGAQEEADVLSKRVSAIAAYTNPTSEAPLYLAPIDFWTREMGYSEEEAQAIIDNAQAEEELQLETELDAQQQKIEAGVEPDPNAAPVLDPIKMKAGETLVPHPANKPVENMAPGQPRDPSGTSTGGQWTDGGAGASGFPSDAEMAHAKSKPMGKTDSLHGKGLAVLTTPDGKKFLFKPTASAGADAALSAQREVQAASALRAMGVDAPEVKEMAHKGKKGIVSKWVDATDLSRVPDHKVEPAEASRIALASFVTGGLDRHPGNYMVKADGKLVSIDHEFSFMKGVDADPVDVFQQSVKFNAVTKAASPGKEPRQFKFDKATAADVIDKAAGVVANLKGQGLGNTAKLAEQRLTILKKWHDAGDLSMNALEQAVTKGGPTANKLVSGDNCGTGAGGFKPGNTCAFGGGMATVSGRGERFYAASRGEDKIWRDSSGAAAPEHIQRLGIPPAWKNVVVNPDPSGTVLAKGIDAKGRGQAKYSASHSAQKAAAKFGRTRELLKKRGQIFRELDTDATDAKLRDRAECLKMIMQTGMRPGSDGDTGADHKSYGATTLEGRHVVISGSSVILRLVTGKNKGREVDFPITDAATATMLKSRSAAAGANGRLFATNATELRNYAKIKDGGGFKTKDHRTALGTETAIRAVKLLGIPANKKAYKAALKAVATEVAGVLGNTPSVALKSYIDPQVFAAWQGANQ